MKPVIVVNFKTYKQGKSAVNLARSVGRISKQVILAVQASDIYEINKVTKGKTSVYCQHVDFQKPGKGTGFILAEAVKKDGARGSLLNHSEHHLRFEILKKTAKRCKEQKLKMILCASSLKEVKKILKLKPEAVAFEIKSLIGTGEAISREKPESVKKFAELVKRFNKKNKTRILALCGAGISKAEDVKEALRLGCVGVLVASAVVKSRNPEKLLREMLRV